MVNYGTRRKCKSASSSISPFIFLITMVVNKIMNKARGR
jgi:hypothetical protein